MERNIHLMDVDCLVILECITEYLKTKELNIGQRFVIEDTKNKIAKLAEDEGYNITQSES